MRSRMLLAFELAESEENPAEREAWLLFVVVGGGPTGVELAGALAELARTGLDQEYRAIDPATTRVILVQSAPRVLPAFSPALSAHAERSLRELGVEIRTAAKVTHIDQKDVEIDGGRIAARTTFWAAGVAASPAAKWLGQAGDKSGRVLVDDNLGVLGCPRIFAIGDTAASNGWAGAGVPGLAPAAKQQGRHAANVIRAAIKGYPAPGAFRYRHYGNLATIGRLAAVVELRELPAVGRARLVALGPCSRVASDRRPESCRRGDELALGLPDIPARHTPHHRQYDGRLNDCRRARHSGGRSLVATLAILVCMF